MNNQQNILDMATKQINITDETAAFVDALNVLEHAKVSYLRALTALYGEDQGGEFYRQDDAAFDQLTDKIAHYMALSMAVNMGMGEEIKQPIKTI